ncbi:mobile element protein [Vibrio variabilis]|uniref:Mobile element protein n=1 Tax=Vibrio variabilis TaxID=990271 RepID=A0ABQ0JIJ3_9VIBR|nr:mobile element protein [Vibrio variabilis]
MVQVSNSSSVFKSLPPDLDRNSICVQKEYRTIRRDHKFSLIAKCTL